MTLVQSCVPFQTHALVVLLIPHLHRIHSAGADVSYYVVDPSGRFICKNAKTDGTVCNEVLANSVTFAQHSQTPHGHPNRSQSIASTSWKILSRLVH